MALLSSPQDTDTILVALVAFAAFDVAAVAVVAVVAVVAAVASVAALVGDNKTSVVHYQDGQIDRHHLLDICRMAHCNRVARC